ncbi:MAG: ABC transporter substrate-binding protein [Ruminococcus sp.]
MKKKLICALMTAAMAGSLVSGLTVSADSDSQVTISLYTTLPNKDAQFEQLCEEFMEENPDIKVNYIAYDSSEKQKWMTLYASGDAPTISIMDPVDIQQNIENMAAYDLTEDSWITDRVDESYLDVFKGEDGELYAVPNCVTAMGIVYNKTVIEKATGETFDPSTIKSNADLEALCEKIRGRRRGSDHVYRCGLVFGISLSQPGIFRYSGRYGSTAEFHQQSEGWFRRTEEQRCLEQRDGHL